MAPLLRATMDGSVPHGHERPSSWNHRVVSGAHHHDAGEQSGLSGLRPSAVVGRARRVGIGGAVCGVIVLVVVIALDNTHRDVVGANPGWEGVGNPGVGPSLRPRGGGAIHKPTTTHAHHRSARRRHEWAASGVISTAGAGDERGVVEGVEAAAFAARFVPASDAAWALRFILAARTLGLPYPVGGRASTDDETSDEHDGGSLGGEGEGEGEGEGPPDPVAAALRATTTDLAKVRAWSRAHYQRSITRAYSTPSVVAGRALEYISVFKAGNNNIRYSLGAMGEAEENGLKAQLGVGEIVNATRRSSRLGSPGDEGHPCRFTFLRDPLERFISAYAEFEYRTSRWFTARVHTCRDVDWPTVFHPSGVMPAGTTSAPLMGTKERAKLLLKLLVSLRWVDTGAGQAPPPDAEDPWPVIDDLNCLVAWQHLFSQASNFVLSAANDDDVADAAVSPTLGRNSSSSWSSGSVLALDFVGKLEHFDRDWAQLGKVCGVDDQKLKYRRLPNGGGHLVTSEDQYGTQRAMKELISEDKDAAHAFCLLFIDDYVMGGYELPRLCSDVSGLLRSAQEKLRSR